MREGMSRQGYRFLPSSAPHFRCPGALLGYLNDAARPRKLDELIPQPLFPLQEDVFIGGPTEDVQLRTQATVSEPSTFRRLRLSNW